MKLTKEYGRPNRFRVRLCISVFSLFLLQGLLVAAFVFKNLVVGATCLGIFIYSRWLSQKIGTNWSFDTVYSLKWQPIVEGSIHTYRVIYRACVKHPHFMRLRGFIFFGLIARYDVWRPTAPLDIPASLDKAYKGQYIIKIAAVVSALGAPGTCHKEERSVEVRSVRHIEPCQDVNSFWLDAA